jgi:hypothetical protein
MIIMLAPVLASSVIAVAGTMEFDQSQWMTGDMNEQYPSDSNGAITNSHVDRFYYYERLPMCMSIIDDSLGIGSSSRRYDSALLSLVVAADGLAGSDSMWIYGKRVTRSWSESGVSWNYYHASSDSAWNTSGGDINSQPCMDTVVIDTSVAVYDTLCFRLDTGFVRYMIEENNFGWLMMAENIVDRATFQFYTEDATIVEYRPVLIVYFSEGEAEVSHWGRRRRLMQSERRIR